MRFSQRHLVLSIILVVALCGVGSAQTDLKDDVTGILTVDGSPYHVIQNAFVPAEEVLKIEEGVVVEFEPGTQLEVFGLLQVLGTPSSPVIIRGMDEINPWKGITISGKDADGGLINYAQISGCTIGIQFDDVAFDVTNTSILSLERAVAVDNDSDVSLSNLIASVAADKLSATAMKVKDSTIMARDSRFSVFAQVVDPNDHLIGMVFDDAEGVFFNNQIHVSSPSAVYALNVVDCSDLDINHCSIKLASEINSFERQSAAIRVAGSGSILFDHMSVDLGVPYSSAYGVYATGSTRVQFNNSIIANTTGTNQGLNLAFYLNEGFSPVIIARYNCLYDIAVEGSAGVENFDYIIDNPLWISPIEQDYHLSAGSPCIDAGNPTPGMPRDPDGTISDLGMHYFHQLSTETPVVPENFALIKAYPNPFNSGIRFALQVDKLRDVNIGIYDVLGREVTVIHAGQLAVGQHSFHWNGFSGVSPVSSGIYFIRVKSQHQVLTQRILLVR